MPAGGWERPALAALTDLLVPLALWIVALSADDLLHAALLLAFLLSLVWPGNKTVLANTGRVIAVGLALTYAFALILPRGVEEEGDGDDPAAGGRGNSAWKAALRLVGVWCPDRARVLVPLACVLVINCVVVNLPDVVHALRPRGGGGFDEEEDGGARRRAEEGGGARGVEDGLDAENAVTGASLRALSVAFASEAWLALVALADRGGGYFVLFVGLFIVETTGVCLLNLVLLALVAGSLVAPAPPDPASARKSPRWRAMLGFALVNLAARYAFGAYPLAKALGLSAAMRAFLEHTVGLAPDLPANQLMSQLFGPSVLLIVTHFHRIGAVSNASDRDGARSRGVGTYAGSGSSGIFGSSPRGPPRLATAAGEVGFRAFARRFACLHASKLLQCAGLYFSLRGGASVFGLATLGLVACSCVAPKRAALPSELLGVLAAGVAVTDYAFAIDWLRDATVTHDQIMDWVGVRDSATLRACAAVLAALVLWLARGA